jgi:ABC-type glycerol-3-phosphate transport system substrate-binding protein
MLRCFIFVLSAGLFLTACGDSAKPDSATEGPILPTSTAMSGSLEIWYADPLLEAGLELWVAGFSRQHPGLQLVLTQQDPTSFPAQVIEAYQAGGGPDLIIGPLYMSQWQNLLFPLEGPEIAALDLFVPPAALEAGRLNNQQYAFPLSLEVPLLYLNTDLISPVVNTFEDLARITPTSGALIAPDFWLTSPWLDMESFQAPFLAQGGLNVSQNGVQVYFERLARLQTEGGQFSRDLGPFLEGEVAWAIGSSRDFAIAQAALGDKLALRSPELPNDFEAFVFAQMMAFMFSQNATDQSLSIARAFIVYASQPEQQAAFSQATGLPPLLAAFTDEPTLAYIAALGEEALILPINSAFYSQDLPRYQASLAAVLTGELSPEAAAQGLMTQTTGE